MKILISLLLLANYLVGLINFYSGDYFVAGCNLFAVLCLLFVSMKFAILS